MDCVYIDLFQPPIALRLTSKKLKTPFCSGGRSRIHPSGVGLQVNLPYGRSMLQVDLDTMIMHLIRQVDPFNSTSVDQASAVLPTII